MCCPSLASCLADRVPAHWGLGFAGTLALLGMCYSLLTERVLWRWRRWQACVHCHLPPALQAQHHLRHRRGRRAGLVAGAAQGARGWMSVRSTSGSPSPGWRWSAWSPRSFFLIPSRPWPLPPWLRDALKVPLAARWPWWRPRSSDAGARSSPPGRTPAGPPPWWPPPPTYLWRRDILFTIVIRHGCDAVPAAWGRL